MVVNINSGNGKKKYLAFFFFFGCGSVDEDCSTCRNVGTNHVRKDPGVMRQHISHV